MPDGYRVPPGPSIAEQIGRRIREAWTELASTEEREAQILRRARIRGLAEAVAVMRSAPNDPARDTITEIEDEFRP